MALAVQGLRVPSIEIRRQEDGSNKIEGNYELISVTERVLCNQKFNGSYGSSEMNITWSRETIDVLAALISNVKKDIGNTLGITEDL